MSAVQERPAGSPPPAEQPSTPTRPRVNLPVFLPAAAVTLAVTAWCVGWPDSAYATLEAAVGWVSEWFGWYYVALATAVLVFVIAIGASRFGRVRLGPDHSRPEFSTGAWAAMLFAAGIGTDLMFFAVYEPVTQFLTPPVGEGGTVEAAREATVWTLFHYGISGWGLYALMGMALAYFAYRHRRPLAVRSALFPLIGRRVDGPIGHATDVVAMLGTIFGVATSLGIGVVSLNVGLSIVFGLPTGLGVQIALVVLAVAVAIASAVSGVAKGIKRISQLNVLLAVVLAAFVLVTGRTAYLLDALVLNVGDFVRLFPEMTMQTFAYSDTGDWMGLWTLFFWAWWTAWAAFVGLFLARISRGRTIRQFVAGTLIIPFCYILMWVSIFGNAALEQIQAGNAEFTEIAQNAVDPSEGLWALLAQYPAFPVVATLVIVVGLLFYVTSADSGGLVMANLSSRLPTADTDSAPWLRIFWVVATGALTLAILLAGDIIALQYATVVVGLPFAFVMVLVMVGLFRALRVEGQVVDGQGQAMHGALSGRSGERRPSSWQHRVRRMMSFPDQGRAERHLEQVVAPALREVAAELTAQGLEPEVGTGLEDGHRWVELAMAIGEELPFRYRVQHATSPVPAYGGWAPRGDDTYSRLEVHLRDGGQGHDVMDYSTEQLIDDVMDRYEAHLEFLAIHERGGAGG